MSYQFKNIKVLVVESSRAMFDLTKGVLGAYGVGEIYSAYNCDEGFNQFCKHNPDILIIDWLTEPHNGLELTRRIRQEPNSPNPFVPIIMMTGFSQMKRVIMARDSGVTEFLVKPFTSKTLAHRIELLVEKPRTFVKAEEYFGPDRRRRRDEHKGQERRQDAQKVPTSTIKSKTAAEVARNMHSASSPSKKE